MINEKKAARARVAELAKTLTPAYLSASDAGIRENLLALPEFLAANTLLLYYSIGREPDTRILFNMALKLGKTVALPLTEPGGEMDARIVRGASDLVVCGLGIPEPDEHSAGLAPGVLDVIIVPAAAFDRAGYRLGRGGGYYDRYLLRANAFSVGLAREKLLQDAVPREAHDMSVRCLITEERVIRFDKWGKPD
jgi:5-formyltetrahydrofolate cyclo-ligase